MNFLDFLQYGVIGLSAIMLLLSFSLIKNEQKKEDPRKVVFIYISIFMFFSFSIAVLMSYVQLDEKRKAETGSNGCPELKAENRNQSLQIVKLQKELSDCGKQPVSILRKDDALRRARSIAEKWIDSANKKSVEDLARLAHIPFYRVRGDDPPLRSKREFKEKYQELLSADAFAKGIYVTEASPKYILDMLEDNSDEFRKVMNTIHLKNNDIAIRINCINRALDKEICFYMYARTYGDTFKILGISWCW